MVLRYSAPSQPSRTIHAISKQAYEYVRSSLGDVAAVCLAVVLNANKHEQGPSGGPAQIAEFAAR